MKTIVAGALYANIDCEVNFPRKVSCSIKKIKRKQIVEITTSKTWCEEVNSQYLTPFFSFFLHKSYQSLYFKLENKMIQKIINDTYQLINDL